MNKNIKFKVIFKKLKKPFFLTLLSFMFTIVFFSTVVLANPPGLKGTEPKIVSGTFNLLQAATGWLTVLIPPGAGLFLGFHAWQKSLTDDQAVIAEKNKLMKNVLIGAAIATTATSLAWAVLSFYV